MDTTQFLRDHGIQPSQQRLRIYQALSAVKTHPAAETIYKELIGELPTLSRTTVFSTLDLFARQGIAQRLAISGTELRYDADTSPHVHFHCRLCGSVSDLPRTLPPAMPEAPEGYVVESSQFFVEGICPACAAKGRAAGRAY
jgi:Fur family transcriptional regulator, peroxide stress response regulator